MSGRAYTAAAPRPRPISVRAARSGPAGAGALAVACVLALALIWVLAELVPAVQLRDATALYDFTLLAQPLVDGVANHLVHLLEPPLFVMWGLALVAIALARERPRTALAIVAVMALAPLSADILKPLLAHPHASVGGVLIGPASWPSGHSAAALALVLSAVLVTPARLRPLVAALGGLFTAAVGASLLILAWHMPSDVLGGFLVATFWAAVALAALRAADRRWPRSRPAD
jgi:membrane-associated phospholipid phosphatase